MNRDIINFYAVTKLELIHRNHAKKGFFFEKPNGLSAPLAPV